MASVDDCYLIDMPRFQDERGTISVVEQLREVPFEIRRVFWAYDLPGDRARGSHAHKTLNEVMVCLKGGLVASLDDGRRKRTIHLKDPSKGLFVAPMVWASYDQFEPGTVYLVLASQPYDASDYYRDHSTFLRAALGPAA